MVTDESLFFTREGKGGFCREGRLKAFEDLKRQLVDNSQTYRLRNAHSKLIWLENNYILEKKIY